MKTRFLASLLMLVATGAFFCSSAAADPYPDELLKFYQMPLNNGFTPYFPIAGSNPAGSTYGSVPSTAIFPGHDELSTAWRTSPDPLAPWQGEYMADDFADYAGTPVTHVRWWGSYLNQQQPTGPHVSKFLISFEYNVPASIDPLTGATIPSHPDVTNPGNLHQIVSIVPGGPAAPPPPGTFTEKPIPTPPGPVAPPEGLFEYNAELNLDKWFNEKKAGPELNNVYWLKIVALVDEFEQGHILWGWHNRDWSIKDDLAAKPGDTPDGAERSLTATLPGGEFPPLWHFEDDAVRGGIAVIPDPAMPIMPRVDQFGFEPQNYVLPWDLPTSLPGQYSKDLAFELYTRIPEPASATLFAMAIVALIGWRRRG